MPKKGTKKRVTSIRTSKPVQLPLIRLKLYFLLLPLALVLGAFVFIESLDKAQNITQSTIGCCVPDLSHDGSFQTGETRAHFEGVDIEAPSKIPTYLAEGVSEKVLGETTGEERWIEIDLSDQKIIAWEGSNIFLESLISTGKRWTPTPTGEFRVWYKTKSQKMSGGSKENGSYYYLPNVPYIMFFHNSEVAGIRGYSLHGTYWHNNFGNQMSHGCVNLPTPIAEQLYYWTNPTLAEGKNIARATDDNPGTRIVIHE